MKIERILNKDTVINLIDTLNNGSLNQNENSTLVINRSIKIIDELINILVPLGLTGDILLVTLHKELDTISSDLVMQNNLDINSYSTLIAENLLHPAKALVKFKTERSEYLLERLAKNTCFYKYTDHLTNGEVSPQHLDLIRACFAKAAVISQDPVSKLDNNKRYKLEPNPMLIWLLVGTVYFALNSHMINVRKNILN